MSNKRPLSRKKFDIIVLGCMAVLEKHGFTSRPVPKVDTRIIDIFEDICFGWFKNVSSKPKIPAPPKRKTNLTQKQMNQMTLECALVFVQEGIKDVYYAESLNYIRRSIANVLKAMVGCKNSDALCFTYQPGWGCYKLWEEVARQEGLGDQKIAEIRKWFKENQSKHYETA